MSAKNKKNKKKKDDVEVLLVETVKKEAASPAHIQDDVKKSMWKSIFFRLFLLFCGIILEVFLGGLLC